VGPTLSTLFHFMYILIGICVNIILGLFFLRITGSKPQNLLHLVSNPKFAETMNPLRELLIILADLVLAAIFNFKMAVHISVCKAHIDFILVSRPMFSGSRNTLRAVLILLVN
jgi:hypothetical protein